MNNARRHRLALAELVLVTMIWGSGFIATQYALDSGLATAWIIALRFLIGAAAMGAVFFKKVCASGKKTIVRGSAAGLILFFAFYCQTAGQKSTSVSNAAFITAANVMLIPLLLWGVTRKRPPARVFLLCALTMLGVVLLTVDFSGGFSLNKGDLLMLLCAALFAAHITYVGLRCTESDPAQVTFWQLLSSGVAGLLAVGLTGPVSTPAQWQSALLPIVYLGLFSTCLCYLMQTHAQHYTSASQTGVVLSMEGVFGTLFSVLLGLEAFRLNMLFGGALITLSVILMEKGRAPSPGRAAYEKENA